MTWQVYNSPDKDAYMVWPVDDQSVTPEGISAEVGQVIVQTAAIDPETGGEVATFVVWDSVPADWTSVGELTGEKAHKKLTADYDPRADLWLKSTEELGKLATKMGVEYEAGGLKKDLIYKIDAARTLQLAPKPEPEVEVEAAVEVEPEKPKPAPAANRPRRTPVKGATKK